MDPVSIVGGVIAIATFIRDIIQLAGQIQKSIDGVPQSRKNLRKLTADITRSFIELGKVYEDRKNVLDESGEIHAALSDLSRHMHAVYGRCVALTVPGASGRINKLRAAFKAWSNCNIIEAEIMELKDEVQVFSMRFMMFAIARIEKPISGIASATARIEQTLVVLDQHQKQGLSRMEGFVARLRVNNAIDVNYPQPVTANTTRPPDAQPVTSEAVEELYLHRQVETITSSLGNLATARTFASEQPRGPYLEPFKPDVPRQWGTDKTPSARHREVVAAAWEIIDILQGPPGERSVQHGAWRMVNLAIRLHGLEMYSDAATIGSWTVDLYRILLGANTQVYEPYLSLALRNLARYKTDIGDHEGASKDIEECVARERDMLKKPAKHSVRLELSNSLLEWWCIVTRDGNSEKGLEIAQESLAHLQSIRAQLREWELWTSDIKDRTLSLKITAVGSRKGDGNTASGGPCVQGWDDTSMLWLDYDTARTYQILSHSLESIGRIPDAWEWALQALVIYRDLCNRHPGHFDVNLAGCLAYLSHISHFNDLPPSASIKRMQESVQLYRNLSTSRPVKFTSCLIESLWDYATLLYDSGEFDAARQHSAEALELTRHSTSDRLLLASALQQSSWSLKRLKQNQTVIAVRREVVEIYRDLSIDPTTIADRLYDLSSDHLVAGQIDDAVAVCKEAVEQYRSILPPNDGSLAHLADLAKGLSYLTHTLNGAQQHSQALWAGSEAIGLYRRLIVNDPSLIEQFLNTLHRTGFSACHANDPQAIIIHTEILDDFRDLAVNYPDRVKWLLVDALFDHDFILTKHLRTYEAYVNSEELVGRLQAAPLEGPELPSKLKAALITHAGSFAELGRLGEALILCEDAIAIGQKVAAQTDNSETALGLADALSTYSQCLRSSGRSGEALHASETAVKIYRLHPRDDTTVFACRLRDYSINLRHANRLPEAIAIAEEAVKLCRPSSSTAPFARTRLPYVLETLSTSAAEAGDEACAFGAIQEATDLYRQIKSTPTIAEPWVFIEAAYANTLVSLSSRFAARNNWEDAAIALSEATMIYKRRVAFSPAYHSSLVRALDLASVHLCVAGCHEKAILAAKDLLGRQHHLDALDPELGMLVRVALAELRGRRSQSALRQRHRQCDQCSSVRT